ncbi:unnamed protein product [Ambrosiozyma monospora]|uniref:Unnamed protein product n=1 Tax=Ambrosiozyma monospora TaxID=43982 RepID=A0A9W6Z5B7_AMBMO|nr:unnamed protein product [Ambrosiozyma monospora]
MSNAETLTDSSFSDYALATIRECEASSFSDDNPDQFAGSAGTNGIGSVSSVGATAGDSPYDDTISSADAMHGDNIIEAYADASEGENPVDIVVNGLLYGTDAEQNATDGSATLVSEKDDKEKDDISLSSLSSSNSNSKSNNSHKAGKDMNWFQRHIDNFKPVSEKGEDGSETPEKMSPQLSNLSLQMIAIGGSIGTGLFVGSGTALAQGGPGGILICYLIVSIMIYTTIQSLSELAVTFPVPGAFSYYATHFIDRSWGFAVGWNYCMQWLILLPLELSAATMTFKFWNGFPIPDAWLITIFFILIIVINMLPVRIYGYAEVVFSLSKIISIIGFLIVGIVILIQNPNLLQEYWTSPGAFTDQGFKGVVAVFVTAAFSFSGAELCGLCAAETPNPRKTVPKASKQVFWRILGFYMTTLLLISFLVPSNDYRLIARSTPDANSSPFVIALDKSNLSALPSIMNVVILVSILSVGNSAIYASSRTLVSLAQSKQAPRVFGCIDKKGRPMVAIALCLALGCIAYISLVGDSASVLFSWLMSLSGLSSLFTWNAINFSFIRFRAAMKAQNASVNELGYISNTGLVGAWIGFVFTIIVLVAQFWIAISPAGNQPFSIVRFLKICLGAFVIFFTFFVHKLVTYFKCGSFSLVVPVDKIPIFENRKETTRQEMLDNGFTFQHERSQLKQRPFWYRVYKTWC